MRKKNRQTSVDLWHSADDVTKNRRRLGAVMKLTVVGFSCVDSPHGVSKAYFGH